MVVATYRDLAEFGLPFITPGQPAFDLGFEEIRRNPTPFGPVVERVPERAAILENRTGRAVIVLSYVWRYTNVNGETRTTRHTNLGSSRQLDVLTGREKAVWDMSTFILPGSARLITEDGMFGDNRDVLPPQTGGGGGWMGARGGGGSGALGSDAVAVELELDTAILEDGLCVGPDAFGLRERLTEQITKQIEIAGEIVRELRAGAMRGRIFDMLRPLAGERVMSVLHFTPLLSMFARSAINHLTHMEDTSLLAWFEAASASTPLQLHPPK